MPEAVKDWLRTKHCTLWANWDITDKREIEEAAEWFAAELQSFEQFWMSRPIVVPNIEAVMSLEQFEHHFSIGRWDPPDPLTIYTPPPGVAANPLEES